VTLFRVPATLLVALATALAGIVHAQQVFPNRPVRIIIPFTPGGTNDILARFLAPKLAENLGQNVIVDNRPGGNTVIASQALLAANPDGHTLSLPGNSHVLVPYLSKTPLPFDSLRDFAPVASLARTGLFLVVHPALPAKNLPEFIALAKAKPGALNSAAPGGSINQLATEMFNSLAGVKLVHIPYKGSAPAMADVMAGQAQLSFQTPATVLGNVRWHAARAGHFGRDAVQRPESADVYAGGIVRLRRESVVRIARAGRHAQGRRGSAQRRSRESHHDAGFSRKNRGAGSGSFRVDARPVRNAAQKRI